MSRWATTLRSHAVIFKKKKNKFFFCFLNKMWPPPPPPTVPDAPLLTGTPWECESTELTEGWPFLKPHQDQTVHENRGGNKVKSAGRYDTTGANGAQSLNCNENQVSVCVCVSPPLAVVTTYWMTSLSSVGKEFTSCVEQPSQFQLVFLHYSVLAEMQWVKKNKKRQGWGENIVALTFTVMEIGWWSFNAISFLWKFL